MSERSLAHIERVVSVEPIAGADKIEKVTVLGWQCVCAKDKVKKDDLVCYVEIDSVVPPIEAFSFLADRKYRVKTIKLKGQISQGLIVELSSLDTLKNKKFKEGDDVTSLLGIKKYESLSDKEANDTSTPKKKHSAFTKFMTRFQWYRALTKTKSKSFPSWISVTDEERIQNIPWVLTKHADTPVYITEKLDGQSATYWFKKGLCGDEFGICSRTVRKFEHDKSNWSEVAREYDIKNKLRFIKKFLGYNLCIQGEIIGGKIQGNKYRRSDMRLYIFNGYNIDEKKYLTYNELVNVCDLINIDMVPVLNDDTTLPKTVNDMVELSKGNSRILSTVKREGIVVRSHDKKISFKVINPEFLLKYEE